MLRTIWDLENRNMIINVTTNKDFVGNLAYTIFWNEIQEALGVSVFRYEKYI